MPTGKLELGPYLETGCLQMLLRIPRRERPRLQYVLQPVMSILIKEENGGRHTEEEPTWNWETETPILGSHWKLRETHGADPPLEPPEETGPRHYLDFGLLGSELWGNTFLLFKPTKFVVISCRSHRKQLDFLNSSNALQQMNG